MAQRKSPPAGRTTGRPADKRTSPPGGRPAGGRPPAKPPVRKKGSSIVNQKQTPWGLIAATAAVVLFAAAVVGVVIATNKSDDGGGTHTSKGGQTVDTTDAYRRAELPAAEAIPGVVYRVQGNHTHVQGHIKYDTTPPTGGDHSQYWADCTGTVYSKAIANENAVHMLEHGAIWITYDPAKITGSKLDQLKKDVAGNDRMALSPYPNLASPISLQAWGYQLKVDSPTDPRIQKFITTLKYNQKTTPEYGASCSQPTFKDHPSTFGHPLWEPAGS